MISLDESNDLIQCCGSIIDSQYLGTIEACTEEELVLLGEGRLRELPEEDQERVLRCVANDPVRARVVADMAEVCISIRRKRRKSVMMAAAVLLLGSSIAAYQFNVYDVFSSGRPCETDAFCSGSAIPQTTPNTTDADHGPGATVVLRDAESDSRTPSQMQSATNDHPSVAGQGMEMLDVYGPSDSGVDGIYANDMHYISVKIACATSGATIRYTTNGNDPTRSSQVSSSPIAVNNTTALKAKAFKSGMVNNDVASGLYTIVPPVATPTFSPPAGTHTSSQSVKVLSATTGATIPYTTNGGDPTSLSPVYFTWIPRRNQMVFGGPVLAQDPVWESEERMESGPSVARGLPETTIAGSENDVNDIDGGDMYYPGDRLARIPGQNLMAFDAHVPAWNTVLNCEEPPNNRGEVWKHSGFDLSVYDSLAFYAKGEKDWRIEFKMGEIDEKYDDSLKYAESKTAKLASEWKKYEIDLRETDFSHVIGGFCWATTAGSDNGVNGINGSELYYPGDRLARIPGQNLTVFDGRVLTQSPVLESEERMGIRSSVARGLRGATIPSFEPRDESVDWEDDGNNSERKAVSWNWPATYTAQDICIIPVKQDIGFWIKVNSCKGMVLNLKQVQIHKYSGSVGVSLNCNVSIKLSVSFSKASGMPTINQDYLNVNLSTLNAPGGTVNIALGVKDVDLSGLTRHQLPAGWNRDPESSSGYKSTRGRLRLVGQAGPPRVLVEVWCRCGGTMPGSNRESASVLSSPRARISSRA